ncbi:hypothetical protein LSG31_09640 [Fodinisporobacter ferrooxydans]|uniref:Uncharacterized protein n=1 Tax=Fodinisporobacter ferrooxydans TaxID=2901836 RepID=A0ABY4CR04_9BACL|nr:hypothetical protein LSG31_09640 [Alicyclobacillaceae bacterium MYW30-H2]
MKKFVRLLFAGLLTAIVLVLLLVLTPIKSSNVVVFRSLQDKQSIYTFTNHQTKSHPIIIELRKFPFPYKAMLAISSDADHETLRKFNLIHEFLNTTQMTPMGRGVGLDIADSFFMYNGSDLHAFVDDHHTPIGKEFTYFKGVGDTRYGAKIIDAYIHDGWLDSMHTYGDFNMKNHAQTRFTRKLAVQAIQALQAAHDKVTVWIDHGNQSNVDNFGSYGFSRFYNYQKGALPHSPYYHTDLLIPYGIKFVWTDRNSSVFGHQSMIYPVKLPDGREVWGFWRYTNGRERRPGVIRWLWSVDDLARQLSPKHLRAIIAHHQYAILAQHFCADNTVLPLPQNARDRLRLLAREYHDGKILVARTSRLLKYNVTERFLHYSVAHKNNQRIIHISAVRDPVFGTFTPTIDDLRGITFYTPDPDNTIIEIGNTPIAPKFIQKNSDDGIASSVSIKWYKPDTANYSLTQPGVW